MLREGGSPYCGVPLGRVPVKPATARDVARAVLTAVRRRGAWAGALITDAVARSGLDDRDGAFATRLVYGVVSAEGTLDEALDRHLSRPGRVHPAVRDVLRIAAYELLFARTPPRAAVHEAVGVIRGIQPSATGMANAVLRRLSDEARSFPWGDPATDTAALARATGHPVWLAQRLIADLGATRARQMLFASLEPAPTYLAHNPFSGSFESLVDELTAAGAEPALCAVPGCVRAGVPRAALRSDALARGACIPIDAAAQVVATLAAPQPGAHAIDCAAGRGGKTLLMQAGALRSGGVARVTAADVSARKVETMTARMTRLGVPGVHGVVADLTEEPAIGRLGGPASADVVLLDAPCSNLGTLRRHPERIWRVTPHDLDSLAELGGKMLDVASRLVRPGGFVVYSTCTVTRRENADVIEGFLARDAGAAFTIRPVGECLPEEWRHWVAPEGWVQSVPAIDGPDGHFAAVLVRA